VSMRMSTGLPPTFCQQNLSCFCDSDGKQAQKEISPRRSRRTRRNQGAEELAHCCMPGGGRRPPPGLLEVLLRALRGLRGQIWLFGILQCATFDSLVDAPMGSAHCLNCRSCLSPNQDIHEVRTMGIRGIRCISWIKTIAGVSERPPLRRWQSGKQKRELDG
jgi:hypothetical protein